MRKKGESCTIEGCSMRIIARGLCSTHYSRMRKHGDPRVEIPCGQPTRPTMANFLNHVVPGSPDECWEWRGGMGANGYGSFHINGRTIGAHRASHMLHIGPLAYGQHVLHSCDNRKCVNPAHLSAGTHLENVRDAVGKLRHAHADSAGQAKLTSEQVVEMRRRHSAGESISGLARVYGIGLATASRAINGVSWKRLKLKNAEVQP